ncbi:hypothetical protein LUU34_01261100 [Aix galericulata]|nr:hypothetical protein LUU34_01261100 [Aix galericulata]
MPGGSASPLPPRRAGRARGAHGGTRTGCTGRGRGRGRGQRPPPGAHGAAGAPPGKRRPKLIGEPPPDTFSPGREHPRVYGAGAPRGGMWDPRPIREGMGTAGVPWDGMGARGTPGRGGDGGAHIGVGTPREGTGDCRATLCRDRGDTRGGTGGCRATPWGSGEGTAGPRGDSEVAPHPALSPSGVLTGPAEVPGAGGQLGGRILPQFGRGCPISGPSPIDPTQALAPQLLGQLLQGPSQCSHPKTARQRESATWGGGGTPKKVGCKPH